MLALTNTFPYTHTHTHTHTKPKPKLICRLFCDKKKQKYPPYLAGAFLPARCVM
jgi:hypothetical protein